MKKVLSILLVLLALLSLASCKKEYFYAEGTRNLYYGESLIYARDVKISDAPDIFADYYPDAVIYLPKGGEYNTSKTGKFVAQVDELCGFWFGEDSELSRMTFHITIYDESGNVIVEKEAFTTYVETETKKLDLTYVSEEFRPYWEAIAVRSDKMAK